METSNNTSTPWRLNFIKSPVCQQVDSGFNSFVSGLHDVEYQRNAPILGETVIEDTNERNTLTNNMNTVDSRYKLVDNDTGTPCITSDSHAVKLSDIVCDNYSSALSRSCNAASMWKPDGISNDSIIILDETSEETTVEKYEENFGKNVSGISNLVQSPTFPPKLVASEPHEIENSVAGQNEIVEQKPIGDGMKERSAIYVRNHWLVVEDDIQISNVERVTNITKRHASSYEKETHEGVEKNVGMKPHFQGSTSTTDPEKLCLGPAHKQQQTEERFKAPLTQVASSVNTVKLEAPKNDNGDFISSDPQENADNNNPEWELLKKLETDEERYKAVRLRWRNLVIPNPNKNLTYRSRGHRAAGTEKRSLDVEHNPTVPSRKRTHSADPIEFRPPAKRQRTFSCTEVFDHKMLDIRKNLKKERNVILQQHEKAVQTLTDKTNLKLCNYMPGSDTDKHIRSVHVQNVVDLRQMCDKRLAVAESESIGQLRGLQKAMEEVRVFNSFYQGLEEGRDDALLLTNEQLIEVLEEDHLYECFAELYKA